MKKKELLWAALFLLSLVAAVVSFVMLQNEKKKWEYLSEQLPGCKIDSSYQVVFIDPDEKCDYIVIKKKESRFDFNSKKLSLATKTDSLMRFFGTGFLDSAQAIKYITNYNEKHNASLTNSSIIDFESAAIMKYLVDMKAKNPKLNFLRVFLADYGTDYTTEYQNKQTSILTVTTNPGGEYFPVAGQETVNYGGLCPPPSTYTDLKTISVLLGRSIEVSNDAGRQISPGGQRIIKQ